VKEVGYADHRKFCDLTLVEKEHRRAGACVSFSMAVPFSPPRNCLTYTGSRRKGGVAEPRSHDGRSSPINPSAARYSPRRRAARSIRPAILSAQPIKRQPT
jgi:hypothetical protein